MNIEREIRQPSDWNNSDWDKLWLYNLHYFDDLNARDSEYRKAWHQELIAQWIVENPPGQGNGWEPYPTSLRIVSWIKWALAGNQLSEETQHSLAIQCRYLASRLEWHLSGNHLFENAKALIFGGLFFDGSEATYWLDKGCEILGRELLEQILPDGGHFERSPMYHSIILEDVLDLINMLEHYPDADTDEYPGLLRDLRGRAGVMLTWQRSMTHADGRMALLNDAAFGIGSEVPEIEQYASQLGLQDESSLDEVVHLRDSGYIRVNRGPACAFLDVGCIGPDYLPGHAHADTLSFELSLFGCRTVVDSGTSTYEPTAERLRQRGTAAHNTLEINNENSSEVWGSFRVARRAYPLRLEVAEDERAVRVRCAHDGYRRLRGRPVHQREWSLNERQLTVVDRVTGRFDRGVARFHFHPDCVLLRCDESSGAIAVGQTCELQWQIEQGRGRIVDTTYHPEFGVTLPNKCLEIEMHGSEMRTRFNWIAKAD